jgi:hypothetical protein
MLTFKRFIEQVFKKGDRVVDINPTCKQYKSKGIVTNVKSIKGKGNNIIGKKVCYKCTNTGKSWEKNEELEKTVDQLKKK